MFTRKRSFPKKSIKVGDYTLPWRLSTKYLGLLLDNKMNWTKNTDYFRLKGIKALNCLHPILKRRSKVSSITKLKIYKTLVRPCITYAAPVWSSTCESNYTKLQVVQNKAIKTSFNTPLRTNLKTLHSQLNFPTLKQFITNVTKKFYLVTNPKHHNPLISAIGQTRSINLKYINTYHRYRLPHHLLLYD